ncbi:MAG: NAD(P)/FAD-dependent oxidoreductase [Ignisphaera sp.]
MIDRYDVVIIGAGVAGSTAAYFIAKNGYKVALVDIKSEESIGNKVCGDAIGEHHFTELNLEAPIVGEDATNIYDGVRIVSPDEHQVIDVLGKGYSLNREKFGYKLYKKAVNAGADAYLKHYYVKPLIEGSWVKGVEIKDVNGYTKRLNTKIVIDASGVAGVVRTSLPLEWWVSERIPKNDFCITYREIVEGDIHGIDEKYAYIFLNTEIAPGGYWWLFPKGSGVYNIGLGLQWKGNVHPKKNYDRFIRTKLGNSINRIIHAGGGLVPTRRPLSCMVWNGLVVIGDAAATANPVHGGGIGSAMISAKIAANVVSNALHSGLISIDGLWEYHIQYHKAYGAKQASLDILRMFMQRLSNNDYNFVFKSRLVNGDDVYNMGSRGELSSSIFDRLKSLLTLVSRPSFLAKLYKVKQYMDQAYTLYLSFPQFPTEFLKWRNEERNLFNDFARWLQSW